MTADIVEQANGYGRHDYRHMTALLRSTEWQMSREPVEKIRRAEGLNVLPDLPQETPLFSHSNRTTRLGQSRLGSIHRPRQTSSPLTPVPVTRHP